MAIATDSIVMIVCNLGAVVYIAAKVVDKVDKHQEVLPRLVEAIDNINKGSAEHLKAIGDLYEKYDELSSDFHELKGEHKHRRSTDKGDC